MKLKISINGSRIWSDDEIKFRSGGPAIEDYDGYKEWRKKHPKYKAKRFIVTGIEFIKGKLCKYK